MKTLFFSQLTSILLLLIGLSSPLLAQQTYALKPYAITLPRLTTAQQSTSAPQQAGNLVYNTDQKQLAVHNGTSWQYVNTAPPEAAQFKNTKGFFGSSAVWIVPAGVTRILAEVWGAGAGGSAYSFTGSNDIVANGGGAGGYARGYITVSPGETLTISAGIGGSGGSRSPSIAAANGGMSYIISSSSNNNILVGADGGYNDPFYSRLGGSSYGLSVMFSVAGGSGTDAVASYGQRSATEYMLLVKCGDGGTAYGAQPSGVGSQVVFANSTTLAFKSGDGKGSQGGSHPGGGGGGGYNYGGLARRGWL